MKLNNIISLNSRVRELSYSYVVRALKLAGYKKFAPSHGDILAVLYGAGTLSKTQIAKKINRDRSTVTTLVQKLESLGYVKAEASKKDSRTSLVSLTEKGKKIKKDFYQISKNMYEIAFQGLSDDEIVVLQSLLEKVYENFSKNTKK